LCSGSDPAHLTMGGLLYTGHRPPTRLRRGRVVEKGNTVTPRNLDDPKTSAHRRPDDAATTVVTATGLPRPSLASTGPARTEADRAKQHLYTGGGRSRAGRETTLQHHFEFPHLGSRADRRTLLEREQRHAAQRDRQASRAIGLEQREASA